MIPEPSYHCSHSVFYCCSGDGVRKRPPSISRALFYQKGNRTPSGRKASIKPTPGGFLKTFQLRAKCVEVHCKTYTSNKPSIRQIGLNAGTEMGSKLTLLPSPTLPLHIWRPPETVASAVVESSAVQRYRVESSAVQRCRGAEGRVWKPELQGWSPASTVSRDLWQFFPSPGPLPPLQNGSGDGCFWAPLEGLRWARFPALLG